MDSYYLTKDDFDYIAELGVGPQDEELVKIPPQVKSNFTRKYNALSHPLPFIKTGAVAAPAKSTKEKPDLEEAIEESDDEALIDPAAEEPEEEELDLKKDKYVQAPKKRKAPAKKGGKGKKAKDEEKDDDEDDEEDEEPPPKRQKGKGRPAKGKGK